MKPRIALSLIRRRSFLPVAMLLLAVLLSASCADRPSGPAVLTADLPLHLEDHLDAATVQGSEVPEDFREAVEWRFDEPQPDWKPVEFPDPAKKPVQTTRTEDALRLILTEANSGMFPGGRRLYGGIYIDLPGWKRGDWAHIAVRARTTDKVESLQAEFNKRERPGPGPAFRFGGEYVDLITTGEVQTYLMRADWSALWDGEWEDPWQQLGITVSAREPASIDILSVSVVPKETTYAVEPLGVKTVARSNEHRRTLFTHTPVKLAYTVRVPESGRLDLGLGVLRNDVPVVFRVTAGPVGGEVETLLEETYTDQEHWGERSVDLSHLEGQTVTVALEANAEPAGSVALWAAPTLSGSRATAKPNIVFYIIDGAGADLMSVYGYNRRTTPNLERLAAEGAVFEHAYSNSTWTRSSTASFMTSLQHSVLGGYKSATDPLPEQAVTMAEHLHHGGYQTASFTANPWAGTMSSLDRGVDALRESWEAFSYFAGENHSVSSVLLHEAFWRWREAYPAEPYWVHFQTTDPHRPWRPEAPFAGLFVSQERGQRVNEWRRRLDEASGAGPWFTRFDNTDISPTEFYTGARGLYDETMAHNDYQIGRLIKRLKAEGEWEHTLFIVAADHSHWAAGLPRLDPMVPPWLGPMFSSFLTHIPLIVVWPERIAAAQRFSQPVSMIDVLPTILDLVGLPPPEVMQGQSLAPLLLGEEGFQPRPVIFDEFYVDWDTGELSGTIEVIDGRWGALLAINPSEKLSVMGIPLSRPAPLLLYDLWNDPDCLHTLHEERPDLVEKYTQFLEAQWQAHQALAQQFTRSEDSPVTPEQLRTLRALGYIQ